MENELHFWGFVGQYLKTDWPQSLMFHQAGPRQCCCLIKSYRCSLIRIYAQNTNTNAATAPKVYALKIIPTEYIIHTLRRKVGGAGTKTLQHSFCHHGGFLLLPRSFQEVNISMNSAVFRNCQFESTACPFPMRKKGPRADPDSDSVASVHQQNQKNRCFREVSKKRPF